jgi:hypothetical protein
VLFIGSRAGVLRGGMLPNVRVMIVALLASIVGIGCGLSALAAFRVNHQPFARMESGNPPLQLVFANGAPVTVIDGAPVPFGFRFQVIAPVATPGPTLVSSNQSPPSAVSAGSTPEITPTAEPRAAAEVVIEAATEQPTTAAQDSAVGPVPPPEAMPPAAIESTASIAPDSTPSVATPSGTDAAAATPVPKDVRRRVAKAHRRRNPQSAAAAQNAAQNFAASPFSQFALQGTAQETPPSPQSNQQRMLIKRHRLKTKAAQAALAAQPSVSTPTVTAARR